jgi:nucleotide-binding universal stress UspA family protein
LNTFDRSMTSIVNHPPARPMVLCPFNPARSDEMALSPQLPERPAGVHKTDPKSVVVVGVDDSETSWNAFWWSCGETKRLGGGIVAVFVSPAAGSGMATTAAAAGALAASPVGLYLNDQAATELAEHLRLKLSEFAIDAAVDFEFVHAKGDAAAELVRISAARNAYLIVVGKSGKVLHRLAGSLGRRLIGNHNAPVVVVVP